MVVNSMNELIFLVESAPLQLDLHTRDISAPSESKHLAIRDEDGQSDERNERTSNRDIRASDMSSTTSFSPGAYGSRV